MSYKEVIANSLQKVGPTSINMHKIENHFIMDIDYTKIVNAIVDDLESNGYTINTHQQPSWLRPRTHNSVIVGSSPTWCTNGD